MKIVRLLVYAITNLFVLNVSVAPLFAEVPATPKILFTSVRDGNYEVYVMDADGSHQVNLTQDPADDFQAIWSPTGEQILFVSDRNDGLYDLYLMNPDGSDIRRVFKRKRKINRTHPTWSPDSKQIAYRIMDWNRSRSTIYIATLGEQDEQEFVIDGTDPAWAPDGTGIACNIEERLTFVNLHTRARKQFLPKKAIQWQRRPSWSQIFKIDVRSGIRTQLTDNIWNFGGDWFDPAHALPVSRQPHLLTGTWGNVKQSE